MLNESESLDLLNQLCVELGFCLAPAAQQRLVANPPADVESFVDAVLIEEGLDPLTANRHLCRQVRDRISAAFRDAAARGAILPTNNQA